MPPRSLASLAYALAATSDLDGALIALGECLAELDRGAAVALQANAARANEDARRALCHAKRADHQLTAARPPERVQLLGLAISLIMTRNGLPTRLLEAINAR